MMKAEFFRDARNYLSGPLAGVHVVEATTTAAGPLCAGMLADLGAEVIKVETPQGEVSRRLPPGSSWHKRRFRARNNES